MQSTQFLETGYIKTLAPDINFGIQNIKRTAVNSLTLNFDFKSLLSCT